MILAPSVETHNLVKTLSRQEKLQLIACLEEKERRKERTKLFQYRPYAKQADFHAAGAEYRERLFRAGNQVGKTIAGGFEAAMHATGHYPEWWKGRRFDKPTNGWASGVTSETTRDNVQRILLGRVGSHGTGSVPGDSIIKVTPSRGVADAVDNILVKHVSGGTSTIAFKSYEKGREKWQGESLEWVWYDEEPPEDIYTEGLTRTNATGGLVWMTFTPLLGMSEVVRRFLMEQSPDRHDTNMTIAEAEHYTEEERARIIASYPEHEREARAKGIPILGSGRIFPVSEESISCDAVPIADHWVVIGGLDFGWDHPTAAAKLAWDRDADCLYVVNAYKKREATPIIHAASVKPWGKIPWAWPHDGLQHDKGSGDELAQQYRDQGLDMLPERATFDDGTSGVEAGLMEMLDRMQTGRFKVFRHLVEWFEEFRLYHRKDGKVVKEYDDLMSATRYAMMMKRHAVRCKPKPKADYSGGGSWMGM